MIRPPRAKRVPHVWHRSTGPVEDEFAWLRDLDDPDTLDYLKAENAYAEHWLSTTTDLQSSLFEEIRARTQETDVGAPVRWGPWWYVSRTVEGLAYPIHCRGATPETATDEIVLDENVEAGGQPFFALGDLEISPDHALAAWTADTTGGERHALRIRELATGKDLADVVDDVYYSLAWSADCSQLFYTVPDEAMRPYQVRRHRLGTSQADDAVVWEEPDDRFFLTVELTRSGRLIVLHAGSATTSEVRLTAAERPLSEPVVVWPRRDQIEYSVDDWGDRLVILTNDGAEDFRVVTAPVDEPAGWTELVPGIEGQRITHVAAFADHLALREWAHAAPRIRIVFRDGGQRVLAFDEETAAVALGPNPEFATSTVRVEHQSLVTPPTAVDEDVRTAERVVRKVQPVPGVDLTRYRAAREWATAPDGVQVPIDVVWHTGTPLDGTAALCLYGYGAYEESRAPWFSVPRLSLLDRGVVWALAHPRGAGELARRWYLDGKLFNKRNTFTDFIACAEHLVARRYGARHRLGARGGSAGGLLVGAAMAMRPELFRSVVAMVPFVDVVSTMYDPTLPLTVIEWEEWGNPEEVEMCAYLASYSPYDNVAPVAYPALYVTAGLTDPRVSFHEPAKWVAKLRTVSTGDAPILLRTELSAGHAGPTGRYEEWRDEARVMAFLLRTLGAA